MAIGKNIASTLLQYKRDRELTTVELATELHLAVSTTQEYLNGDGNPRADTLEMIAQRMNITVVELISSPPEGLTQTRNVIRAAKAFASLPPDKQEKGIQLFLEMIQLWSEDCLAAEK